MNYSQFKTNYPAGSSVGSPEGKYKGQCVSYVRQYMALVDGIKTGPLGDAVDFASNATFLKFYKKVSNPQQGDIIVWGDDPGAWTGIWGHIAIFDTPGYMINQNFNGSLVVSRNPIFTPGLIGYYRLKTKEAEMPITKEQEQTLALLATGSIPGKDYDYPFVGKPADQATLDTLLQTWESRTKIITKEMENQVADGISGVKNYIGWAGYNSKFVGQPVVRSYQDMVVYWIDFVSKNKPAGQFELLGKEVYVKKG